MVKKQDNAVVTKGKITRYLVRNSLFRLRDNRIEPHMRPMVEAIWKVISEQLRHPEGINGFTFTWDVDPEKPLRVIRRDEWDKTKAAKYPLEYKKQTLVEEEITLFTGQQ